MQAADLYGSLKAICGEDNILKDVPMRDYTSMRVGGRADIMVQPDSIDQVQACVAFLSGAGIPFFVMGNGSNLIFPDEGYRGVILKIGSKLSVVTVKDNRIIAEAGALLSTAANKALEHSLTGLEFASGIPGSVGGAAFMNAGAYDGEMKQVVTETLNMDKSGGFVTLRGEEHDFSYRPGRIQDDGLLCLRVVFMLEKGDSEEIRAKMNELNSRRRNRQPLNMSSAGSVFKRPPGQYAGKLIEDSGLKGFSIGGARVSEKHCGFIVNTGDATASDVIRLIEHVQNTVYEKTGYHLEPEVKIVGRIH